MYGKKDSTGYQGKRSSSSERPAQRPHGSRRRTLPQATHDKCRAFPCNHPPRDGLLRVVAFKRRHDLVFVLGEVAPRISHEAGSVETRHFHEIAGLSLSRLLGLAFRSRASSLTAFESPNDDPPPLPLPLHLAR